ncbi:ACP S-malonyltransferase [Bacillus fonticola]|uniref:ACP S-malonyltransferase n=1 Tax=Bacillus fonticola TaxID=2728853 RepID=UPI0014732BF5|nr:ACP S-malonyltransferase [Bacillus fonticola]
MRKTALLFPGQGSQAVGMGKELAEHYEEVKQVFNRADERLQEEFTKLIFEGPIETLTETYNAQPALLTTSVAILEKLKKEGVTFDVVAGHSLGEYSALVAAGVLSFEDAVYAVRQRGIFMEEAVPNGQGAMAAVLGMPEDRLAEVCKVVSKRGNLVQLANINCPGQIVISGTKEGVDEAGREAKEQGAKRVIPLNVSGPFHSKLMEPAGEQLQKVLKGFSFQEATVPVVANATAQHVRDDAEIEQLLIKQITSPVLWAQTIQSMLEFGVDTFIEVGPGKVLSGLVKKIERKATVLPVYDEETLQKTLETLRETKGEQEAY